VFSKVDLGMTYNKTKPIFKKNNDMHNEDSNNQMFINSIPFDKNIVGNGHSNAKKVSSQFNTFSNQNLNIV